MFRRTFLLKYKKTKQVFIDMTSIQYSESWSWVEFQM